MLLNYLFIYIVIGLFFCIICVLLSKNAILSVISLIGFFLNGSSLLFFFKAEYLGIVYIMVYVGAIAVLFLFVVMMLDFKVGSVINEYKSEYSISSFLFLILFFIYLYNFVYYVFFISYNNYFFKSGYVYKSWINLLETINDIGVIGYLIYSQYFLLLILCGLILLISMCGSIILTLFKRENIKVQNLSDQILRTPKLVLYIFK